MWPSSHGNQAAIEGQSGRFREAAAVADKVLIGYTRVRGAGAKTRDPFASNTARHPTTTTARIVAETTSHLDVVDSINRSRPSGPPNDCR